jgi:hypothetical protein
VAIAHNSLERWNSVSYHRQSWRNCQDLVNILGNWRRCSHGKAIEVYDAASMDHISPSSGGCFAHHRNHYRSIERNVWWIYPCPMVTIGLFCFPRRDLWRVVSNTGHIGEQDPEVAYSEPKRFAKAYQQRIQMRLVILHKRPDCYFKRKCHTVKSNLAYRWNYSRSYSHLTKRLPLMHNT